MSVQFILGTSGTGKTHLIFDEIADRLKDNSEQRPLILLVPEQATYQAERAILSYPHIKGFSRLKVLSFRRLAFMLGGRHIQSRVISKTAENMIIARIISRLKDQLNVFHLSAASEGLAEKISNQISEFLNYCHDPEDIEDLIKRLKKENAPQTTVRKFSDLLLIYRNYLAFLDERDFLNTDSEWAMAVEKIQKADFIKDALIWIDGFSEFSSRELEVIYQILLKTENAKISLCLDPDLTQGWADLNEISIFAPTIGTYRKLTETITGQLKLKIHPPVILKENKRFKKNKTLAHIESSIFKDNIKKIDPAGQVKIINAHDQRDEINFIAKEICRLVREENYRYRDFALIVSGLDEYKHFVRAIFNDSGIPFFIDTKHPLTEHPIFEFLYSALSAASKGLNHRDIFSYLKSGYADVDIQEISRLENYCLAFEIKPFDWKENEHWNYQTETRTFNLKFINRIRNSSVIKLKTLHQKIGSNKISATDFAEIIVDFLNTHNIFQKLSSAGDQQLTTQLINHITTLLTEIITVYHDENLTGSEFAEIFTASLADLKFAQIPPKLDQVLVGSIERSRHPEIKTAFLVGATQKQFPAPLNNQSILNEAERQFIENRDFILSPTLRSQLLSRQYLAYIAFTRPHDKLYITCPTVDDKGNPLQQSYFLSSLQELFNDNINYDFNPEDSIEQVYTKTQLLDRICLNAGRDSDDISLGRNIVEKIKNTGDFKPLAEFALSAAEYKNPSLLDEKIIDRLLPEKLNTSVSRLNTYASCPFKYYAKYALGLETRLNMQMTPLDIGDFYHKIIDRISRKLLEQNQNFKTVKTEKLQKLLDDTLEKYLKEENFISNFYKHSNHNAFIIDQSIDMLNFFVKAIVQQAKTSDFQLTQSEMKFGYQSGEDNLEIDLSGGRSIILRGKIDRLDTCDSLGIVIDYKKSGKSPSWQLIYHGLDLQLPVYLLAGKHTGKFKPAGAFFMPIECRVVDDPNKYQYKLYGIFDGQYFQKLDTRITGGWSSFFNFYVSKKNNGQYSNYNITGVLRPEEFGNLMKFTEQKIKSLAEDIFSGQIQVRPYRLAGKSPCSNCDFKPVCRFDWQINEYNFMESLNKTEVMEEIKNAR